MEIGVRFFEDAGAFWEVAGEFLRSRAVLHNLVLTIVNGRLRNVEPGRYWVAMRGRRVVGVALQSPLTFPAAVVPMEREVVEALVDAMAEAGIQVPGVTGEAGTAASFAGRWTERYGCGAFPVQGLRLYELGELQGMGVVAGSLRAGGEGDRALAAGWMEAFYGETRMPGGNATGVIAAALAGGGLWVWENGGAVVSMAISSRPMEGVVRVSGVYTPPAERRRGYAGACVYGVSQRFAEDGYRCVLYTDLGNPTSNSIYRGMGYRLVSEGMQYRFGERG